MRRMLESASSRHPSTVTGYRCVKCDARFERYSQAERHVDRDHGGGRVEVIFDISTTPNG